MNTEKPGYYSIIPATVRYDNELSSTEKLFYGEISALCDATGSCTAGNKYFARLYDIKPETVSRIITKLQKKGYIKSEIVYKDKTKEIEYRKIILNSEYPIDKKINTYRQKSHGGIDKKVKDNNTSNNNKETISKDIVKKDLKKPTLVEIEEYIKEKNYNIDPKVFYDYFEINNWKDSKGNKVKNWKQKLITWNSFSRQKKNTKAPEWLDKKLTTEILTTEELKELEKEMKIYEKI